MNAIEASVTLTPQQVALAFWNLGSDGHVAFFAELDRLAGLRLCFQMAAVVREMAIVDTDDSRRARTAFRTMLTHASEYANDATEWRCIEAKFHLDEMARDAKRRYVNPKRPRT